MPATREAPVSPERAVSSATVFLEGFFFLPSAFKIAGSALRVPR